MSTLLSHTINAHGLAAPLEQKRSDALAALLHRQQQARLLPDQDAAALALVALGQRERLQARGDVDGVADHGVLEAIAAADVAADHRAAVEADAQARGGH